MRSLEVCELNGIGRRNYLSDLAYSEVFAVIKKIPVQESGYSKPTYGKNNCNCQTHLFFCCGN